MTSNFQNKFNMPPQTPLSHGIYLVPASDTPPVQIQWLWHGWLASGKFHLLAGAPGTGKTTLAMEFVARFTVGGPGFHLWPDKAATPGGHVVIWTGEDGIEDTIIPRLIAAGANLSYVHVIHGTIEHGRTREFDFQKDLPRLTDELEKNDRIGLIVIDSIVQAVAGDSNKNSDVRKALAPLIELAERHNCAIVGVTHINKNSKGKDPLDRVTGSLAYGAAARIVLFTIKIQTDLQDSAPQRCVLVRAKSNIGKDDGGFEYQITPVQFQHGFQTFQASKVVWGETPLQGSAKEIVKYAETGGQSEIMGAVEAAKVFLKTILAAGPRPWPEIETLAQQANISPASLKRAKLSLNIQSQKQSGAGAASPSIWYPPATLQNNPFPPSGMAGNPNQQMPYAAAAPLGPMESFQSLVPQAWQPPMPFGQQGQFLPQTPGFSPQEHLPQSIAPFAPPAPVEPVEPLEPVAPVEPVEPVAPVASATTINLSILQTCITECRQRYARELNKPDYDGNEEDLYWVIEETVEAVMRSYFEEDAHCRDVYGTAIRNTNWWTGPN